MKETCSTPEERARKRSLPALLLHKFLTESGYANGLVIAQAIVDEILHLVEECYQEHLPPKRAVWLAVRRDGVPQCKALVMDSELALLNDTQLKKERAAYTTFQQHRLVWWCREAYEQGVPSPTRI